MSYESLPNLRKISFGSAAETESKASQSENIATKPATYNTSGKLESAAFYIFLLTVVLAPLAFWPSRYAPFELIKTLVITLGTLTTALLYGYISVKEKRLSLPPVSIFWTSILIAVSLIVSSLLSTNPLKSFFGQGFEIGTASFVLVLFVGALSAFAISRRETSRAVMLYVGLVSSYAILYLLHLLRLLFGEGTMTLGILDSATASIIGGWYNLASFSILILIISTIALAVLRPSSRMKTVYWALLVLSAIGALMIADQRAWFMSSVVMLGLVIYFTFSRDWADREARGSDSWLRRIAWLPLFVFILSVTAIFAGTSIAQSISPKLGVPAEISLPWQMTLDISSSAIKNYPLFGVGPNNFSRAYLAYKPVIINTTNAWNMEFMNGFGLIPTFITNQGLVGLVLWILFFVFLGLVGSKTLRKLPRDAAHTFLILSAYFGAVFLWLMTLISVPSHAMLFTTLVMTGIFAGVSVASASHSGYEIGPFSKKSFGTILTVCLAILVLLAFVWGLVVIKKSAALAYFSRGVKVLNTSKDTTLAESYFSKALKLDNSDIYWRAMAETTVTEATAIAGSLNAQTPEADSKAAIVKIAEFMNQGLVFAQNAIKVDPGNYYNHVSEARISEAAADVQMDKAYDNAVQAYLRAISVNPYNPSLYLYLAGFQARNKKYDDAIRTLGSTLQIKNNYLDAVFLLSQIYASKGDLSNAIVAADFATQLNPNNAVVLFQAGLLKYTAKDYTGATKALEDALKIQPDYANVAYFLGLSYARQNRDADALKLFEQLAATNSTNEEVALIVANLKAGKSIFADSKPVAAPAPEKRSKLPIKDNR